MAFFRAVVARVKELVSRAQAVWRRLQPTLPVRAWNRYGDLRGDRLAGAASFYGFSSLFPLLALSAAIASTVAGDSGVETVQNLVDDNFPEMGLDVSAFRRRAGAVGAVGALLLMYSGLRWVDAMRAAVRSMWGMDDQPGNVVVRKLLDAASLAGLGVLLAISWGASVVVRRFTRDLLDWLGVEGLGAQGTLEALSWVLSIAVNAMIFAYLLAGLPRILVPARLQAMTALVGAVIFEILKTFLVEYVAGPGSQSYGAFATPLIVIGWIYIVTRLLMVLAAVTAESAIDHLEEAERAQVLAEHEQMTKQGSATVGPRERERVAAAYARRPGPQERVAAGEAVTEPPRQTGAERAETGAHARDVAAARGRRDDGRPSAPGPSVVVTPSARQARRVGLAAGAVLGAAGTGLAILTGRAVRTLRSAIGSGRSGGATRSPDDDAN
ncbi:YihY/virulence factor BrkB family protein [Phytoactinopolyspora halotolerans]|uniref:YihY/virulence factor BrkB family protein n=1 Tax=Phytoactinopolyspora halotolerans TaxID=1981512 RepID=A0A6L9S304_9ACTN|nr:YihY/virulence factor BrkB family protein [Phytoactinopolyspora halotolerans]NED99575.1 YihY/virulence factor BrkB family protein [Phytoactinopolyspora halotolerans]